MRGLEEQNSSAYCLIDSFDPTVPRKARPTPSGSCDSGGHVDPKSARLEFLVFQPPGDVIHPRQGVGASPIFQGCTMTSIASASAAPAATATDPDVDSTVGALDGTDQAIDVWAYLAENINEFAVAKTVVDHFDAFPKDLANPEVDLLGLYVRAKLTLKRNQISYAQAQQAVELARLKSKSLAGVAKSFTGHVLGLRTVLAANPGQTILTALMVVVILFR
jgi:hypothetical protein